ncbi:MAG: response regulator [Desulfobacteraceae bacterium]|nr:response regulator [Desulfobacteraceae bacterium]
MELAKILVVEDDINVATVLQARLESFGHKVCSIAANGVNAIRYAKKYNPDLILMDILLDGDMNGIEAAEQINEYRDFPIIFLSCLSDQGILDRAMRTKPFAYIVKPYNNAELRSTIEITMVKHHATKEREELIQELENALREIKRLSGLLPICASCKKIRNEDDRWQPVEDYIASRSEADFSHGICPECAHKLYPDLYKVEKSS